MNPGLIKLLRCPLTKEQLTYYPIAPGDWGEHGILATSNGANVYPVLNGVPVMLARKVPADFAQRYSAEIERAGIKITDHVEAGQDDWSFSDQWSAFQTEKVEKTWIWDAATRKAMFWREIEREPAEVAQSIILDAGSGNGVLTNALGEHAGLVVGLDYSTSVFAAAMHQTPNVVFVRGDLSNPPFAPDSFDIVYSSGVLHHTPNTQHAFDQVATLTKPGGLFYCWLYWLVGEPKALFTYAVSESVRVVASRSPRPVRNWLARAYAGAYFAAFKVTGHRQHSYSELLIAAYDGITPRYARRHTPRQVAGWYDAQGFGAPRLTHWDNPSGWGMYAVRDRKGTPPGIHFLP